MNFQQVVVTAFRLNQDYSPQKTNVMIEYLKRHFSDANSITIDENTAEASYRGFGQIKLIDKGPYVLAINTLPNGSKSNFISMLKEMRANGLEVGARDGRNCDYFKSDAEKHLN
jgi:hypothetical protein